MNDLTGVLSDQQINLARELGHLVIEPFRPEQLNNASYNVTLGDSIWRRNSNYAQMVLAPSNAESVRRYWSSLEAAQVYSSDSSLALPLNPGDRYFLLQPNEFVLAHTAEFIGSVSHSVPKMQARSSTGRCGVTTCLDAGWGDIGYFNRWTMEIHNQSGATVVLRVGDQIAQIIFHHAGPTLNPYSKSGAYQTTDQLKQLIELWTPNSMLPSSLSTPRR